MQIFNFSFTTCTYNVNFVLLGASKNRFSQGIRKSKSGLGLDAFFFLNLRIFISLKKQLLESRLVKYLSDEAGLK
jgi:hypothetical protein